MKEGPALKPIRLLMLLLGGLLSLASSSFAGEALTEGRIITLAFDNKPTVLAPSTKEAEVFQLILRHDLQTVCKHGAGEE